MRSNEQLWVSKHFFVLMLTLIVFLQLFDILKYAILDAGFDPLEVDDVQPVASVEEFIEEAEDMPKLIYTHDPASLECYDLNLAVNDYTSPDQTLFLEEQFTVVQTEEYLMRGHDYNTDHEKGIALLIAASLSSERAYIQALGRVGRYGRPCKRFKLNTIQAWDSSKLEQSLQPLIDKRNNSNLRKAKVQASKADAAAQQTNQGKFSQSRSKGSS